MEAVINYYSLSLIFFSVVAFVLSLLVHNRLGSAARWFSICMAAISLWGAAYGIGISQSELSEMLFWVGVEYVGISLIPVVWFVFVLKFTGRDCKLNWLNMSLMFGFSIATMVMVWTNPMHHLHYSSYAIQFSDPFYSLKITRGPWYFIHTAFFYALIVSGMVVLFRSLKSSNGVFRKQILILIAGTFVPWIANALVVSGAEMFNNLDTTPFAFLFTSIVIGFGFLRFRLFDIVPMARDKVINAMQEGWLVIDPQNRIIDYNPNMAVIMGIKDEKLAGRNFKGFGDESADALLLDQSYEATVDIAIGDEGYYEVTCKTLRERDNEASGRLFIFRDIAQYEKDQQKLRTQAAELKELNEVKNRLLSIISHDVRSPLAALTHILEMSNDGELTSDDLRDLLPKLGENLNSITGFLDNLLVWAKSQFEGETVEPKEFDICSEIRDSIDLLSSPIEAKRLNVEFDENLQCYAYADPNMIRLVVRNLLSNAVKFCRAGDSISFEVSTTDDYIKVAVVDSGIGISEENLERIFSTETFTTHGTEMEQGTGLGLMLSKDFIAKNNGEIWAESQPGVGSTFFFTVPLLSKSKLESQSHLHNY